MPPPSPSAPRRSRLLRWAVGLGVLLVLLAVYVAVLQRVSLRLDHDMQRSLRESPDTQDHGQRPR